MNFNPATPLILALCILVCVIAWDRARGSK